MPLTLWLMLAIIQQFCVSTDRTTPFTGGVPGRGWLVNFEQRHHGLIRRRNAEYLSTKRAKGMSEANINKYFNMLGGLSSEPCVEESTVFDL